MSLFSQASVPDMSNKVSALDVAGVTQRKRSISDSDGGKSPAILEEEEGGGGGEETKPECDTLIPAITVTNNRSSKPKIVRHRKSVHIIEPERDGNSNFKPTEAEIVEETVGDSDEEFQSNLRQYLEDYLPEDEEEEPPQDGVMVRLYKGWPGWEKMVEKLRYTVAGIVFLLGVLSLIFTLLPGASATEKNVTADLWTKLERQFAPWISMRHHRPPPT